MCFNISGTSKFPAAQTIVRKEKTPPVLLRETLAYGTKYGMGVFCLFKYRRGANWLGARKGSEAFGRCEEGIPPGGDSHMKVTGMLVGKLELTP